MLVAGIAVVLMLIFGVGAAVTTNGRGSAPPDRPTAVAGTSLRAVPATRALATIEQGGEPPSDIVDAVTIPAGSVRASSAHHQADGFDAQVGFAVTASQAAVIDFYRTELHRLGWHVSGPSYARGVRGGVEVLGVKAGSDGWYWELGAVVSPTTFAGARDTTPFFLRLFQVPEPQ
ncbi:MAG: hypothetical protein ACYCU7_10540 [Acidimicrobiales bacterium]